VTSGMCPSRDAARLLAIRSTTPFPIAHAYVLAGGFRHRLARRSPDARRQSSARNSVGDKSQFLASMSHELRGSVNHGDTRQRQQLVGKNHYHQIGDQYDRLPAMAADLISRRAAVIVPIGGAPATVAAKAATSTIPIVFNLGADPIGLGLVTNLNRPGGNITGIAMMNLEIETKRLELLHELAPASTSVAVLLNPSNAQAQTQEREAQAAARVIGRKLLILKAATEREIESAFATLVREQAGALLVGADTFFNSQAILFVVLTARHAIPTIYPFKSSVDAGGLMSYGTSLLDAYRQTGVYAGRVLKGEKPGDLPIVQPTKFELVINLKTARAVGIAIPPTLLARADEVIE
jgi:putative tryptophan/tyrosine transport system substrate-binding protein